MRIRLFAERCVTSLDLVKPIVTLRTKLADPILGLGRSAWRFAKKLQQPVSFRIPCSLFEKCRCGFHDSYFLGDGGSNPLIQGHTVFFRETLGGLLNRI